MGGKVDWVTIWLARKTFLNMTSYIGLLLDCQVEESFPIPPTVHRSIDCETNDPVTPFHIVIVHTSYCATFLCSISLRRRYQGSTGVPSHAFQDSGFNHPTTTLGNEKVDDAIYALSNVEDARRSIGMG